LPFSRQQGKDKEFVWISQGDFSPASRPTQKLLSHSFQAFFKIIILKQKSAPKYFKRLLEHKIAQLTAVLQEIT